MKRQQRISVFDSLRLIPVLELTLKEILGVADVQIIITDSLDHELTSEELPGDEGLLPESKRPHYGGKA